MFSYLSIAEIHHLFQKKELDPIDLAQECISRYEKYEETFHAWECFDKNSLIKRANKTRELISDGYPIRLLEGIPIGVKDIFNTIEFPTQMGSEIWKGFTPGNDARVVYYLKNSGASIAGKTVTAEFAVHELNKTLNPHNIELTPGTSSSGSAVAVALGIVPVSLGSQTGASIIRPASFNGVYGFKPSFGLIPRTGSLKTTDSLDTVGFFVSIPSDLRRVFDATRVHGLNFPLSHTALNDPDRQTKPKGRPWKLAFVKTHTWEFAEKYAQKAIIDFVNMLSLESDIRISETEMPTGMEEAHAVHAAIYDKSLSYYFKEEYKNTHHLSPIMKQMIEQGERVSIIEFKESLQKQNELMKTMDKFNMEYDAIICLSTAGSAPPRHVVEKIDPSLIWTLTHQPSLNAPTFLSPNGEPFGIQLISRKYNDLLLINLVEELVCRKILPSRPNSIPHLGM